MKKMKRILCLLLTLVMCLSMVDLSAFAVDTEDVDSESVSETVQEVYTCGKEEHAHDKTCYEEQLVLRNKDGEEITVSIEAYDFDEPAEEYEGYEPVLVDEQDEDENVESDSEGAEDPDNTEDTVIPEDPENSESPVVPENSESPVVPENPENPVVPENPENPVIPENPENPVVPENPENPVVPENPENPVVPENPENPVVPENPENPVIPEDPENPVVPENPENPVTPENPAVEARVESVEVENRMSANVADDVDTVEDEAGVLDPENHTYTIGGKSYLTESVLACAFKDVAEEDLHTHTLECVGAFANLVAGLEKFGPKLEAFQEEYYANLTEDDYDEFGDLTEEAMAAFTEAAAAELGEEFNALVNLYKAIPERFADDPAYTETAGTLTNLAGLLGGDLDSGIMVLTTAWADLQSQLNNGGTVTLTSNVTAGDGDETLVITKDTILNLGSYTINGNNKVKSVIHVKSGTLTLKGTTGKITGGKGTLIKRTKPSTTNSAGKITEPSKWTYATETVISGGKEELNGFNAIIGGSRTDVTCGGGILLTGNAKLVMEGGYIDNNNAAMGAGICAFRGAKVTIYGGSITNNTASAYAGGGMFLGAEGNLIDPTKENTTITITGNKTNTTKDLGGGGIFVDSAGSLEIRNAVIANNKAGGLGGGVAGCLHGMVSNLSPDTAAIYSNKSSVNQQGTAITTHTLNNLVDHDSPNLDWNDELKENAQDYFVAGFSNIGSRSLGGGSATWSGTAVLRAGGHSNVNAGQVSTSTQDPLMVQGLLGLKVTNAAEVASATHKVTAAKVDISNNYSNMHGGGVGTNGLLTFGETNYSYSSSKITLKASKNVTGAVQGTNDGVKSGYEFELYKDSTLLGTATSDANGNITFLDLSTSTLFGTDTKQKTVSATLTLKEVKGNKAGMTYDETVRTIALKATREASDPETVTTHGGGNHVSVATFTDRLSAMDCTVTPGSLSVSGNTVTLKDAATFTNTMEYGNLTLKKELTGSSLPGDSDIKFTFKVTLTPPSGKTANWDSITLPADATRNGNVITAKVKASNTSGVTISGIPAGAEYTVHEDALDTDNWKQPADQTGTIVANGTSTVKFTNERNIKEVTVTKTVVVEANSKTAPTTKNFTIKVQIGDGSTEHTVSAGNNAWQGPGVYVFNAEVQGTKGENGAATTASATAKITGVPSNVAVGQAVEEALTGADKKFWKTTVNGTTVINSYYEPDNTDITVKKEFSGGEKYLPESVTVELLRGGVSFTQEGIHTEDTTGKKTIVTLNGGNNWQAEWKNLLKHSPDGNHEAYVYTVKEVSANYPTLDTTHTLKADDRVEGSNIIRVRNTANKTPEGVAEIVGGWLINEPAEPVNGVFTVTNTWLGNEELGDVDFTVKKTDSLNDVPIQGVTFTLTKKDASGKPDTANKSREVVTGEDGVAKFEALTDGTYTLTETVAPAAYQTVKDKVMDAEGNETEVDANVGRTWELKIVKGTLKSVEEVDGDNGIAGKNTWNWKVQHNGNDVEGVMTITNRPLLGSLTITKDFHGLDKYFNAKDFEGKEFKFVVKNADDSDATHVVEKDGKLEAEAIGEVTVKYDTEAQKWETVTITGLRYGEYTISEVIPEVPDNYTWEGVKFVEVKESTEPTEPEQPDEPTEPTEPEQPSEPDAQADDPAPTESGSQGSVPATPVNPMDSMHQIPLTPATPTYSKDASITVKVEKNEQQVDVKAINVYKHKVASLTIDKTAVSKTPLLMGEQFIFEVTLTEEVAGTIKEDSITFPTGDGKTITFTKQDDAWKAIVTITLDESDNTTEADGVITYEAGSVTIKDIPAGLTYDVHETSRDKWIVAGEESGTLTGDTTVAITNTRATGSLTISKLVKGLNEADFKDKVFTFTVRGPADVDGTYGEGEDAVTFVDREVTVTVTGAGSITIEGLPTGEYTVKENEAAAQVSGYNLSVSVISPVNVENGKESTSTVTNTYSEIPRSDSTSLTVTKAWQGDGSIERPASVTVQLLRDGEPYGDVVTLKASDKRSENWRHTWTGLSRSYTWSVDEVDVPQGYSKDVKKSGTTYTITNTYTPETDIPDDPTPQSGILSVNKVWAGDAGANRPDSVTVQIFKDGTLAETVTLNSANGWSYSKVLSEEEQKSIWSVGEVNVPEGYKSTVSSNGTSFTVTNTYGDTDIPDEEKPTTDIPDEQPPLVDWPDEWPPLVSWPEEPIPVTDIPLTDIPDDDVPLANVPQTGDISLVWYVVAAASAMGLAVLTLKKRKDEED